MEMKVLRPFGMVFALIFGQVGLGLTIGGFFLGHYADVFTILLNPLTLTGIAFLVVALVALVTVRKRRRRLSRIKDEGFRFDAEVVDILAPFLNMTVGTMFSTTGKIECAYVNHQGERCLIVSREQYMINNDITKERLTAVAYVDRNDPSEYAIEVFKKDAKSRGFDRDYR